MRTAARAFPYFNQGSQGSIAGLFAGEIFGNIWREKNEIRSNEEVCGVPIFGRGEVIFRTKIVSDLNLSFLNFFFMVIELTFRRGPATRT